MRVAKQHIHMGEIFRCAGLAPMQRYLLMAIADYGLPAWPSQARLANKTGLSRSSINTMVSELRRLGVLTTEGRGKSLTYRIDLSGKGEVSSAATPHLSSTATAGVVHSDRDQNSPRNSPMNPPSPRWKPRGGGRSLGRLFKPSNGTIRERRETYQDSAESYDGAWKNSASKTATRAARGSC